MYFYSKFFGRVILLITLLMAPWFWGGLENLVFYRLYSGIMASCLLVFFCSIFEKKYCSMNHSRWFFELSVIPLFLAILWGFFQLLPISNALQKTVSPHKIELCQEFISADETPDAKWERTVLSSSDKEGISQWSNQITISSSETKDQLALLVFAVSAFIAAGILFDTKESCRWLWRLLVGNGLLLALYCIATRANVSISFYMDKSNYAFGPFFNRNNGAGYLCLCLGAAFGILTEYSLNHKTHRRSRSHSSRSSHCISLERSDLFVQKPNILTFCLEKFSRWTESAVRVIKRSFFPLLTCGVIFAAILISLSRGGALAAIIGILIGIIIFVYRQNVRYGLIVSVLFLMIWGFLLAVGLNDSIKTRMSTLVETDINSNALLNDGRWKLWNGSLQTVKDFQGRGSGLGTYYLANRKNDPSIRNEMIGYNAENQWLETLVNAGYIGVILGIFEFLLIFAVAFFAIKQPQNKMKFALGVGMIVLLVSQAISGTFDFGLFIPANILILATLCGSFVSCYDCSDNQDSFFISNVSFWKRKIIRLLILIFALFCCFLGNQEIKSIAKLRETQKMIQMPQYSRTIDSSKTVQAALQPWNLTPILIDQWIELLKTEINDRKDDFKAHLFLADLWELRFRLTLWERFRSQITPEMNEKELNVLWEKTHPMTWLSLLTEKQKLGQNVYVETIRSEPAIQQYLKQALKEVLLARKICPVYPAVHYRLAVYFPLVYSTTLDEQLELTKLYCQRTVSLSPEEPRHLFLCGFTLLCSGDAQNGFAYWQKSLNASTSYFKEMMTFIQQNIPQSQWTNALDQTFPKSLKMIAKAVPQYSIFKESLLSILKKRLEQTPFDEQNASFFLIEAFWQIQMQNYSEAAQAFEKAIELDPKDANAYYEYGILLFDHPELQDSHLCELMFKTFLVLKPQNPNGLKRLSEAQKRNRSHNH